MRWTTLKRLACLPVTLAAALLAPPVRALELPVAGFVPWAPVELRAARVISTTPLLIEVADKAFLFPMAWFGERPSAHQPPWRFTAFAIEASLPPLVPLGDLEGHLDNGGRIPGRGIYVKITVTALPPRPIETFDAERRRRLLLALWSLRGGPATNHVTLDALSPATEESFGLRALSLTRPTSRIPSGEAGSAARADVPPGDDVFVAENEGLITTYVRCQPILTPAQQARLLQIRACDHDFHWRGMAVSVRYHRSLLPEWHAMEHRVSALLDHFRQQGEVAVASGALPGPQ